MKLERVVRSRLESLVDLRKMRIFYFQFIEKLYRVVSKRSNMIEFINLNMILVYMSKRILKVNWNLKGVMEQFK